VKRVVRFEIGIRAVSTLSRSRMSWCYLFDTAANAAATVHTLLLDQKT
jgi:hypothetical protein